MSFPWDYIGFEHDCSNCPAILNVKRKYITRNTLKYKRGNLPDDIELITGSVSDYKWALQSSVFNKKSSWNSFSFGWK